MINLKTIIAVIIAMTGTHIFAINYGFYTGDVWIDLPLHFTGGFLAAMVGYWAMSLRGISELFGELNLFTRCFILVSFSLIGSLIWEIFEFSLLYCCESWARTGRLISPSVSDVLSDMAFGVAGGIFFVVVLVFVAAGNPKFDR
jgi:hypothetical protein